MEKIYSFLKLPLCIIAILFFLIGFSYFLLEIEESEILDLRYCPHCGVELLR